MSGGEIERRIFVVGVPRSGTTLLQSLLAAHSQLTSFTESHFFSRYFRAVPGLSTAILTRDPTPRLIEFLRENPADDSEQPAPRLATGRLLPLASRRVGRQLLAVLDQLALSRGFAGWIEKTPRHLRYLPFLERLSERTHFVHVLRDGVDTVASLLAASRSWPQRYDLATCIQRWNRDVAFSLSRLRRPNDHFVFYEDLTRQPEATLEPLLGALGLEWEEGLAERYGQGAERLIADGERWKAGVGDGVRPAASTAGSRLSPQQLETAQRGLRHELYTRLRERAA